MILLRNRDNFHKIANALKDGRVIAMACDTIYGFVGRVPDAEVAIRRIKGREQDKPFLILIAETRQLEKLNVPVPNQPILKLWPGPFTFIFKTSDGTTLACRMPKDNCLRELILELDAPLFSSSVNRSGCPAMDDPGDIDAEFGDEVAFVEDSGCLRGGVPSTIVDLTVDPHRVIRQGAGKVPEFFL